MSELEQLRAEVARLKNTMQLHAGDCMSLRNEGNEAHALYHEELSLRIAAEADAARLREALIAVVAAAENGDEMTAITLAEAALAKEVFGDKMAAARLIAEAPALLDALRAAEGAWSNLNPDLSYDGVLESIGTMKREMVKIRAILARIDGATK